MTAATAGIEDVRRLNEQLEGAHPADAIRWAAENVTPGRLIVASSFGPTGMVNLHSLAEIAPEVPVAFVDTLYHFPETLEHAERVKAHSTSPSTKMKMVCVKFSQPLVKPGETQQLSQKQSVG